MIGVDTNVLARYLTLDEPDQVERVDRLVADALEQDEPLCVDGIVLCELAWVLRTVYDYSRAEVADALGQVVNTRQFAIEDRDTVRRALASFHKGRGDFSDHLIGERNRRAACRTSVTFDQTLAGSPQFETL